MQKEDYEAVYDLWEASARLATRLIINGNVDADNEAYDGVRALYQSLYGLPVTGYACAAIENLEREAEQVRQEVEGV